MLLCNRCGQNKHINDENFIAYRNISGSELLYINCEDANDIVDYGDSDTDSDGIETYECPTCHSNDINTDWEDEDDEIARAQGIRNSYLLIEEEKKRVMLNKKQQLEKWDQ